MTATITTIIIGTLSGLGGMLLYDFVKSDRAMKLSLSTWRVAKLVSNIAYFIWVIFLTVGLFVYWLFDPLNIKIIIYLGVLIGGQALMVTVLIKNFLLVDTHHLDRIKNLEKQNKTHQLSIITYGKALGFEFEEDFMEKLDEVEFDLRREIKADLERQQQDNE